MDKRLPLALTFDDVLLQPGYVGFSRSEISTKTFVTKGIELKIPIISSPMDTVTEYRLAIALAQLGGLGFIHRNLSIQDQASQVTKVKQKGLLVGAAVGSSAGFEKRVSALVIAGVDVLIVDSAHGFSKQVINTVKTIRKKYKVQLIGGNVATAGGAKALIEAGADGLRVGMGPGAICSTRVVSGMGVPQITALLDTTKVAKKHKVPVIADGGINHSGDITKAIAAGASTIMLGRLLAATQESAGDIIELNAKQVPSRFQNIINGAKTYKFKTYRGMGSKSAMQKGIEISSEDEFHGKSYTSDTLIAEGVEGMVPVDGSVADNVSELVGGLVSGMYYVGSKDIASLQRNSKFVQITDASLRESHPHDLFITDSGSRFI